MHVLAGQREHRHLVVTANDAAGFGVHQHFDRIADVQVAKWDNNGMWALIIPSDRVAMSALSAAIARPRFRTAPSSAFVAGIMARKHMKAETTLTADLANRFNRVSCKTVPPSL